MRSCFFWNLSCIGRLLLGSRQRNGAFAIFGIISGLLLSSLSAANPNLEPSAVDHPGAAEPADPQQVLGNESCVKCHAAEVQVWKQTPHALTFDELHRRPQAKQIAAKLGLRSIKHEGRCASCHYTHQADDQGQLHAIAGVSCESCHGAAKHWVHIHHDYGGEGIDRRNESTEHRQARLVNSIAAGMRNPVNVFLVAQSCLRCHTTADETLVNVGGHSAGSLDFEFVSWSQGTIRHNFLQSDGKENMQRDPERIRTMFVAGMIAELEASLRATAVATEKAVYGITVAKRAARAAARIQSVTQKVQSSHLDQIVSVADGISLKLNNGEELNAAADQIAKLGFDFAARHQVDLSPLDPFIPSGDRLK